MLALLGGGRGIQQRKQLIPQRVTKEKASRKIWKGLPEKVTALYMKAYLSRVGHPSTAGHVKSGGNLGGPSPKAKYY